MAKVSKHPSLAGRYIIAYDEPRGANGKRRRVRIVFRGTRRDAELEIGRLLESARMGVSRPNAQTLATYLDSWLDRIKARVLVASGEDRDMSPATYRSYRAYVEHQIKPVLGHVRLRDLTPLHIEDAIDKWRSRQRQKGGGTISRRTVHHIFSTLNAALSAAVRWRIISLNPCTLVVPPKKGLKSLDAVTIADARKILEHDSLEPIHVAAVFSLLTGVRRSELLALSFNDIDLEQATAYVHNAVTQLLDGSIGRKENKTGKSRRMVPLAPMLVALLARYFQQWWVGNEPLFGTWHPETFSSALNRHFKKLGIAGASVQRLRHTFNSLGRTAGGDSALRAALMGHSTTQMTDNQYTTLAPGEGANLVARIEETLNVKLP